MSAGRWTNGRKLSTKKKKTTTHDKLAQEIDEVIEDPSKIKLNVAKGLVESCYFPIVQSGGKYQLKVPTVIGVILCGDITCGIMLCYMVILCGCIFCVFFVRFGHISSHPARFYIPSLLLVCYRITKYIIVVRIICTSKYVFSCLSRWIGAVSPAFVYCCLCCVSLCLLFRFVSYSFVSFFFRFVSGPSCFYYFGPVRSGPVRSGPVRSGPVRSGPVRCAFR